MNNQPIPIQHLSEEEQINISTLKIKEGIAYIESLFNRLTSSEDKMIVSMIPPEVMPLYQNHMQKIEVLL